MQKKKFSIKNFFSKYDQIHQKLRISLHLLKKSSKENFIFRAVIGPNVYTIRFLKYVRPFFNIMHKSINIVPFGL